jgi:hypothetical protein
MRREPKLSSNNEFDIKFIMMFTVAFVVVAVVIMGAGYVALSATGIIGSGGGAVEPTPTPVPSSTAKPTYTAIGVSISPLPPDPTPSPRPPTPTPSPTPVPSPYTVKIILGQESAGSMKYLITFSLAPGSQPLDLTQTKIKIWDWETTYGEYSYDEAMYWLDGVWSDSNGDKRLDPTGESLTFEISATSLKIPLDRETKLALFVDGTQICFTPLPSLQNQVDLSGESPDPGSGTGQSSDNIVRWY